MNGINDSWERKVIRTVNNTAVNLGLKFFHVNGRSNPAGGLSRGKIIEINMEEAIACAEDKGLVTPKRVPPAPPTKDNPADAVTEDISPKSHAMRVNAVASMERTILTVGQRHRIEGGGLSEEEWIFGLQQKDPGVVEVKYKSVVNGTWHVMGRQELSGEETPRLIVPRVLVQNILYEEHDQRGHYGVNKLLMSLRDRYYFRGLTKAAKKYVANCEVCARVKGTRLWTSEPRSLFTDGLPFSVIGVDTLKIQDNQSLLTLTCLYTRYCFAWPIRSESAREIIDHLMKVFLEEGSPKVLICDNAAVFTGNEFRDFLSEWRVKVKFVPRYSGHYAGFYERSHRILLEALIIILNESGVTWKKALPLALWFRNNRPFELQDADGPLLTPFAVFKGRLGRPKGIAMTTDDNRPSEEIQSNNLAGMVREQQNLKERFEEVWKNLREKSFKTIKEKKSGELKLAVGDMVFSYIPVRRRSKLDVRWSGPFPVEELISDILVKVNGRVEHVFNLKKFKTDGISEKGKKKRNLLDDRDPEETGEGLPKRRRSAVSVSSERLQVNGVEEMTSEKSGVVLLW
jgi:hypothetical protein